MSPMRHGSVSSCGPDPVERAEPTWLRISATDCSCVPERIQVFVDNSSVGWLDCGAGPALEIEVYPGGHSVTASSGPVSWSSRSVNSNTGSTRSIDLGCPPS